MDDKQIIKRLRTELDATHDFLQVVITMAIRKNLFTLEELSAERVFSEKLFIDPERGTEMMYVGDQIEEGIRTRLEYESSDPD